MFQLPANHTLVPIDAASAGQPLRICIAVRQTSASAESSLARQRPIVSSEATGSTNRVSSEATGLTSKIENPFVLLRSTLDARVYLGAVIDATAQIREWLEIWIQTTAPLLAPDTKTAAGADPLTPATLDARWRSMCDTFIAADPAACIQTGHEHTHPRPAYIDLDTLAPWHPAPVGASLATPASAPPDQPTPPDQPDQSNLSDPSDQPAPSSAPSARQRPIENRESKIENPPPLPPHLIALNPSPSAAPAPGLLFIRRLAPISLDDYAAFLGGRPWKGTASGRDTYNLDTAHLALADWDSAQQHGHHLFTTAEGRCGRFIESFHLKLTLLHQALTLARAAVKQRQLPLLNLSSDSFRVTLDIPAGSTLPALWSARLVLVRAGQSIALPIKTADTRYFLALEAPSASVYRPAHMGRPIRGNGAVRIRRVFADTGDRVCIEGTLVTHDRVGHSASDILWLRLPLPGSALDLYARLDTAEGLASGEARFRTIPQDLPAEINEILRTTEGAVFPDTPFETIPLLSTPADLYSLAVLGALLLLVNSGNTLGVATDDLIGYARKLGQEINPKNPSETLPARALRVASSDPRILAALGPQRLAHDGVTAADAAAWLPAELWWQVIATLARLIPGAGPDSYCKDYGDASPFNPEKAFDAPLRDLDNLLLRTRGLIISDWTHNREVARIIQKSRK